MANMPYEFTVTLNHNMKQKGEKESEKANPGRPSKAHVSGKTLSSSVPPSSTTTSSSTSKALTTGTHDGSNRSSVDNTTNVPHPSDVLASLEDLPIGATGRVSVRENLPIISITRTTSLIVLVQPSLWIDFSVSLHYVSFSLDNPHTPLEHPSLPRNAFS